MLQLSEQPEELRSIPPFSGTLDSSQKRFCDDQTNTIRLLAPAGSGKTMSLLWRCLRLVDTSQDDSYRLLLVTFTRAARDEIKERMRAQPEFAKLQDHVKATTLNSWANRRLHKQKKNLQLKTKRYDKQGVVLHNLQPVWSRFEKLQEQLTYRGKGNKASTVFDLIDTLKSLGFRHDQYDGLESLSQHLEWLGAAGMGGSLLDVRKTLHDLYLLEYGSEEEELRMMHENFMVFWCQATQQLYDQSLITFEDQKYWTLIEIESLIDQGRLSRRPHRYNAILVDEFQDINVLDLELLKSIARLNQTDLTIVGDDDQAIYEWRGASPQFIVEPERFLGKPYKTHILTTNYRSPRNIVELSARLISNNKHRVAKEINANSQDVAEIRIEQPDNLAQAMDFVVAEIRTLLDKKGFRNVALISRKRSQLIPYQIFFAREGIPFFADMDLQVLLTGAFREVKKMLSIVGRAEATSFADTDPVEDVIALCDRVRRFPVPRRNRPPLIRHLRQRSPRTLAEAVDALADHTGGLEDAPEYQEAIRGLLAATSVSEKIEAISRGFEGLRKDYVKSQDDVFFTDPPFIHLAEYARVYGDDLAGFYRDIQEATAKLAQLPTDEERYFEHWQIKIHLMTALRAKGKEFDAVFILDANDGTWPISLAVTEEEKEQERRLFYVAFTRARRRMYLLVNRSFLGEPLFPSPYLAEMGL